MTKIFLPGEILPSGWVKGGAWVRESNTATYRWFRTVDMSGEVPALQYSNSVDKPDINEGLTPPRKEQHMNYNDAATAVRISIENRIPTLIEGAPGGGKSSIPLQIAQEMGISAAFHNCSLGNDTDILGLPGAEHGTNKIIWRPIGVFHEVLTSDKPMVLVLDDLAHARHEVQAAIWPMVHSGERRIGDKKLPDGVSIIATANRVSDTGAGARSLLTPLRDRFECVIVLDTDHKLAFQHILRKYKDDEGVALVLAAVSAAPPSKVTQLSPRRWENVCKWVSACYSSGVTGDIVAGGAKDADAILDLKNLMDTAIISKMAQEVANAIINMDVCPKNVKGAMLKKLPLPVSRAIVQKTGDITEEQASQIVAWCGGVNAKELITAVRGM